MKTLVLFLKKLVLPVLFVIITVNITVVKSQYLKAFTGIGAPNISDGTFDGNYYDIVPGSGEYGNFLLIDFVSSDPAISITQIKLDFSTSVNAEIETIGAFFSNHLAGATLTSQNLTNNVYTANFSDYFTSVKNLYLGFDFDLRNIHTASPLGSDYAGATITATLSNGTILSGTFDAVDIFIAIAQAGVGGTSVDLWMKDCNADLGVVPSNTLCPEWYISPDIFIDNNFDGTLDAPVVGIDNILRAIVRNKGNDFENNVNVNFYYRNNTTGLVFPDGATSIGTSTVNIPPNGIALTWVKWANLPAPPQNGHYCIGAVISHPNNMPIVPAVLPYNDNNEACANIWYIAGRAGEKMNVTFNTGTGGKNGFGLQPWPRKFKLQIDRQIPEDWKYKFSGITMDTIFELQQGTEKSVQLVIDIPKNTKSRSEGYIDIKQIDILTGNVVGGVKYQVYEDHIPPAPVKKIIAMTGERGVQLTWEPVIFEENSTVREKVAFYNIYRNGILLTKVIRDEDPLTWGMQFTDTLPGIKNITYTISVVDEGNNVSTMSPETKVWICKEPQHCNHTIYIVIIIVLIIIIIFIWVRRRP